MTTITTKNTTGTAVSSINAHAGARFFCRLVTGNPEGRSESPRILVAGCGHGKEAAFIHDETGGSVEAIDQWLTRGITLPDRERLSFREADVQSLPYDDGEFDIVFYHHVIEHVDDPPKSIAELSRVLCDTGRMFIGTPNRHRIVGSVGAYERTIKHKVRRNVHDWKMRMKGQFRNECGAHAGFSQKELDIMLSKEFAERTWLTREYLRFKYNSGIRSLVAKVATAAPWQGIAVPSIYAWCKK